MSPAANTLSWEIDCREPETQMNPLGSTARPDCPNQGTAVASGPPHDLVHIVPRSIRRPQTSVSDLGHGVAEMHYDAALFQDSAKDPPYSSVVRGQEIVAISEEMALDAAPRARFAEQHPQPRLRREDEFHSRGASTNDSQLLPLRICTHAVA